MLSRILTRATTRIAPRRTYMVAGNYSNGSWLQLWAHTGGEGAELWLLTVYGAGMHTIFSKAPTLSRSFHFLKWSENLDLFCFLKKKNELDILA